MYGKPGTARPGAHPTGRRLRSTPPVLLRHGQGRSTDRDLVTGAVAGRPEPSRPRSTPQKRALSAVLEEADGFLSAQDLHAELRARGQRVGLTTVYNQLRALAEAGQVDSLRAEDGEALYRRCGSDGHHHHLVCRRCGRTVE